MARAQRSARSLVSAAMQVATRLVMMPLVIASCAMETNTVRRESVDWPRGTSYVTIPPATTSTTITVPASETTAPAVGAISPTPQEYVVKAGDSLSRIAGLYDLTMQAIIEFNQFSHTGPILHPGDTVRIPPGAKVRYSPTPVRPSTIPYSQAGTETQTAAAAPSTGCTHTISAGENPTSVAAAYGITYDILQAFNPNRDFSTWFLAGATVQIPPGADCS